MGFATCPFIPAFRHSVTFSENASAVTAIIGIDEAHESLRLRIALVASRPFISGICTSIRIRS